MTEGLSRLAEVLARVERCGTIVNDAEAAKHAAYGARMQADVAAAKRRENLWRAGMLDAMDPALKSAIVAGEFQPRSKSQRAMVRWLAQDSLRFLVLQGGTGCGKTAASAYAIAERGGYMRSAQQIVRAFASRAIDAVEEQERALSAPLLVLDDLGTEAKRDREHMVVALRELLESRQGLRTVITTNLGKEQVREAYADARIESRLHPICERAWVVDDGADMRKAAR